jgi:hypothetical protein
LLGQVEPLRIDIDALQARLDSPAYAQVAQSLREVGFSSARQLMSTYAGSAADLAPWLEDATINRDRNLRLQYLAGRGLDLDQSGQIYLEMLQYARFPESLFTGSASSLEALRSALKRNPCRAKQGLSRTCHWWAPRKRQRRQAVRPSRAARKARGGSPGHWWSPARAQRATGRQAPRAVKRVWGRLPLVVAPRAQRTRTAVAVARSA